MQKLNRYYSAEDQTGLEALLHQIASQDGADKAANSQHDILFTVGKQTSLLKIDLSGKQVVVWHVDFLNDRAASSVVKNAIINFIKSSRGTQNVTDDDDDILAIHLVDVTRKKNMEKQTAAGFFRGGKMNISPCVVSPLDTESKNVIDELKTQFPILQNEHVARSFIQAVTELDTLTTSRAQEYARGGKQNRVTLFGDTEKGITEMPVSITNANTKRTIR
jgi:hypothetical protein